MSNSHASTAELAALLDSVSKAAKKVFEAADGGDASHVARRELQLHAKRLVASLEEPNTEVFTRVYQVNVAVAVDIATDLGVWSKFENGKTVSRAEIVESSGADEIMIVRIFRQLVAAGVLNDIPGPGYSITSLSLPYLDPDHQNFNNFLLEDNIPSMMAIPRTLREHGYKAPTKESGSPFNWNFGEELWTWLGSHPDRAAKMVSGMRSLKAGDLSANAYPFGSEMAELDIKDNEVAIVDIAGAQGHMLDSIRRSNPEIRGRFICQDLASTFKTVAGPPPGVEFQIHDFFTPQPVRNAYIYHFRHIIHDWSDEECQLILSQLVPVLRDNPKSRLLLVDLVLPDENATMQDSIRDLAMFPIGGMERNLGQWEGLLKEVGLGIRKVWRGSELEACVECEVV